MQKNNSITNHTQLDFYASLEERPYRGTPILEPTDTQIESILKHYGFKRYKFKPKGMVFHIKSLTGVEIELARTSGKYKIILANGETHSTGRLDDLYTKLEGKLLKEKGIKHQAQVYS